MTDAATPAMAPEKLSLGRTIQGAFGVLQRNFVTFLLLILASIGAPAALAIISAVGLASGASAAAGLGMFLGVIGMFAGFVVLQAAMIHATVADLNGRASTFNESLAAGLKRFLPLLGLMLTLVVLFFACTIPIGIVAGVLGAAGALGGGGGAIGSILLMVVFFIGLFVVAIMVAMAWFVIVPVQVVERPGLFRTFSRSAALTKHNRWRIFGIWLLWTIVVSVLQATMTNLVGGGPPMAGTAGGAAGELAALKALTPAYWLVVTVFSILNTMVGIALIAVMYYELRRVKEGVGPEALASVFD